MEGGSGFGGSWPQVGQRSVIGSSSVGGIGVPYTSAAEAAKPRCSATRILAANATGSKTGWAMPNWHVLTGIRRDQAAPHWYAGAGAVREKLVEAVSSLPVEVRVYGCRFDAPRRTEAARARALRWHVAELDTGVGTLVLDRRQSSLEAKDRRLLMQLLGRPPRLPFGHTPAKEEPFLWLADIVAGAVCRRAGFGAATTSPGGSTGSSRPRNESLDSVRAGRPSCGGKPGPTSGP